MSETCKSAMNAAVKGAFSKEEIDAIADRLTAKRIKAKAKTPGLTDKAAIKQAAEALAVDEVKAGLISTRAKQKSEIAKRARAEDMARMSGSLVDKLEALTIGSDKAGFGGRNSVDAMAYGLKAELIGDVERSLRGLGLWGRVTHGIRDEVFEARIVNDMAHYNGSKVPLSGDDDAAKIARVFNAAIEKVRVKQNDAGAWIGKLDGYVVRQGHDPIKVAGGFWSKSQDPTAQAAAKAAWRNYILPRLDEATFGDLTGQARIDFLDRVWTNIVSGQHEIIHGADDIEGFIPKSGKARAVSAERVLHFKGPAEWFDYHNQFGRGSLMAAVTKDLERAASNIALMQRFGPNPEVAWANEVARAAEDAAKAGDAHLVKQINSPSLQAAFDQVTGAAAAPENLKLAMTGSLLRKHQSVTKLGSMVLSAFADLPVAATAMMRAGMPFLDAYGGAISGILRLDGAARRQAALMLDVGIRSASGKLMSGVSMRDGALGFYTWAGRKNMEIQGFEFWNDGLRSGVGSAFGLHLGQQAHKGFEQIPKGLRASLERFGIDAPGWDKIRAGVHEIEGQRFIFADGLDDATATKFRGMVQDVLDTATSEARGREQRALAGGWGAGTPEGEAFRALTQFLSFPMTYVNRSLIPAAKDAMSGGPVMPLINLIVGATLFGYASMQAKELVKGREPRPLTPKTVMAAMVQGGGLGIYGDFLFGEKSRMGGGLAETFGGPIVGDFAQLLKLGQELRDGITAKDQHDRDQSFGNAKTDAFRMAKAQIPFANLWATRAALDYYVFWRMQEAIDPGWAGRYQRRVEKENGAEFWLEPTEAVQ